MDNQTNENEIFNEDKKERALLISVDTGDFNAEVSMEELEELAKTAGAEVVGTSIQKEDFVAGRFIPKDTFVFVGYRDLQRLVDVTVVDSGMYACVYLDSFDAELDCAKQLLAHCNAQGWTVCGDYFCEIMTEFNVFDDSRRSMFLRLQVPVAFDK